MTPEELRKLADEIERLAAENAELRMDAERYRIVRRSGLDKDFLVVRTEDGEVLEGESLDGAVDALKGGGA